MPSKIYSVFDNKADVFSPPFVAATKGLATRIFADVVNDKNSQVNRYPADFKLVEIGTFDEVTGRVVGYDTFESLGFGTDYIRE